MKKCLIIICALVINHIASAEIYEWRGKDGSIHFTDTPHKGAKKIDLPEPQTYSDPSKKAVTPKYQNYTPADKKKEEDAKKYESIEISSPKQDATIRNNTGNVTVTVSLTPGLKDSHSIQVSLDGKTIGEPQKNTSFVLQNVYRGTHTVKANVLNQQGNVVGTSSVTFHMHRPRVNMGKQAPRPKAGGFSGGH